MPKMKTHSGAKKRFKITGSGKVVHRKAGKGHLNEHKSSTRIRRIRSLLLAMQKQPRSCWASKALHPTTTALA